MNMQTNKRVAWVAVFVSALLLMSFVLRQALEGDKTASLIKHYLENNERIKSEVGVITHARIVKRVSVAQGDVTPAYQLFTVEIKGQKASAAAVVRQESNAEGLTLELESLRR